MHIDLVIAFFCTLIQAVLCYSLLLCNLFIYETLLTNKHITLAQGKSLVNSKAGIHNASYTACHSRTIISLIY
jgi:hypothetical protein